MMLNLNLSHLIKICVSTDTLPRFTSVVCCFVSVLIRSMVRVFPQGGK